MTALFRMTAWKRFSHQPAKPPRRIISNLGGKGNLDLGIGELGAAVIEGWRKRRLPFHLLTRPHRARLPARIPSENLGERGRKHLRLYASSQFAILKQRVSSRRQFISDDEDV